MMKNILRHAFVAMGALSYLLAVPVLLYQYFGLMNGWPGLFLSVVHDASGDWWLDVHWSSPVLLAFFLLMGLLSVTYGVIKRNDLGEYREPEIQSQAGF